MEPCIADFHCHKELVVAHIDWTLTAADSIGPPLSGESVLSRYWH